MTSHERGRYGDAPGLYAISPSALGLEFLFAPAATEAFAHAQDSKFAVVTVRGPLAYEPGLFTTYDAVKQRVSAALACPAEIVVLRVSSPGGDVAGALDCARAVRAMARAAGKQLVGFTESQACSSAYALISASDRIVIADTAVVGSIGVISAMVDETAADTAQGKRYSIITTGARKADGNPHVPVTDDAVAAAQQTVDAMGAVFFGLVATHRPAVKAEDAQALQANVYVGSAAVARGLADELASWEDLSARLATGSIQSTETKMPDDDKKDDPKVDATRASLEKDCASDDPKKAARAKRALAAYDEKDDAKAADDGPKPADDKKKDDGDKASAAALAAATAQLAAVTALLNAAEAERSRMAQAEAAAKTAAERAAVYAGRPDLAAETVKILDGMTLEQVKALLPTLPRATAGNPYAPPDVQPTRGDDKGGMRPNAALDAHLGWGQTTTAVVQEGTSLFLGKRVPVTAPSAPSAPKGV